MIEGSGGEENQDIQPYMYPVYLKIYTTIELLLEKRRLYSLWMAREDDADMSFESVSTVRY